MAYKNKIFGLVILACIALFSCKGDVVFDRSYEIEDGVWNYKTILEYEIDVTDTLSLNDFYLNIRNTNDYPYQNLFLFIKTLLPNKQLAIDTIECYLADDKGEWLGSGLGDIKSSEILFRKELRFTDPGKYLFMIEHGMRKENLEGIIDVGFMIKKSN